jgi:2-oxoisovalerate dehydrogenase E1 component
MSSGKPAKSIIRHRSPTAEPAMPSESLPDLNKKQLLDLYHSMVLIRRCEEQLARSHQRGLIHGACHTYVGQEAIAAGVCAHLKKEDVVFSTHRGHGHALAKGLAPRQLFAELFGRASGCSQGRGGSMHLFAPEVGMMGTSGIVGPCILQAAGAGYSFMLLKSDHVAVAFFGDGAVNNGAFHEGLNMAGIWKLPVLFVCENNQYATEVPFAYAAACPTVASRAASYGISGADLDGNDVLAIYQAAGVAIRRARDGDGPTLLECRTYRTRPHAEGMGDYTYRTRDEVDSWKTRCPIARLRARIGEAKTATSSEIERIEAEVDAIVEDAQQFAESSPWPGPETAIRFVFNEVNGVTNHAVRPHASPKKASGSAPDTSRQITYMQATLEAMAEEMKRDSTIFVMGEGVGKRGGNFKTTSGLYDLYGPARLCDTPICERGFVGLGCGAAMTGTRPVIDFMFADFILDSVGEIINQIAKIEYMSNGRLSVPILLRGCIGIGHSAATHHSGNYYPMYAHFPGLRVAVPSTPHDAKGLMKKALRSREPVIFLEHRELLNFKGIVPTGDYEIDFGQAAIVREGTDVTVVSLALMLHHSLKVCEQLAAENISVELIDPRTVAPLDLDTIVQSVAKTGRLLIVDEAFAPFGFGAEIAAGLADRGFDDLDAPIRRLNGAFAPTPYSPTLEAAVVPNTETIAQAIRDLIAE